MKLKICALPVAEAALPPSREAEDDDSSPMISGL